MCLSVTDNCINSDHFYFILPSTRKQPLYKLSTALNWVKYYWIMFLFLFGEVLKHKQKCVLHQTGQIYTQISRKVSHYDIVFLAIINIYVSCN